MSNLPAFAQQQAARDPDVGVRRRAWSACVARAGFEAKDPMALRKRFLERAADLPGSARRGLERRMAIAEARCDRRTGLATAGERALRRATTEASRRFRRQIATQRPSELPQPNTPTPAAILAARPRRSVSCDA